jgi:23S rRNA (adenine2503-C2)-methyltransferase
MIGDNLEILGKYGKEDLAILYTARFSENILEFVESLQPPISREEKWVLIISTLYGCPIGCLLCDAGEYYAGRVPFEGMIAQIDYMISQRFPNRIIPIPKLKIQFARMGEPSLNEDVLHVLRELPKIYNAPGLLPCISTVAPNNTSEFFESLLKIKDQYYPNGKFQLQFSIHTTDVKQRHKIIPGKIWSFKEISEYGMKWYKKGDRKITLNFAVSQNNIVDPFVIKKWFDTERYLIKLTPVNPTNSALQNNIRSEITEQNSTNFRLAGEFRALGYSTLISVGEWEENQIGSNCGQFATKYINGSVKIKENYLCEDYNTALENSS